jgi:hypothetical protein
MSENSSEESKNNNEDAMSKKVLDLESNQSYLFCVESCGR